MVELLRSSGSKVLDKEVWDAIMTAGPFEPFPPHIPQDELHVRARKNASALTRLAPAPWGISARPGSCRSAYLATYPATGGVKRLSVSDTLVSVEHPN